MPLWSCRIIPGILVSTVAGRHHLHSANTIKLSVQRTRKVIDTGAFAVSAATNRAQTDAFHPDIWAES